MPAATDLFFINAIMDGILEKYKFPVWSILSAYYWSLYHDIVWFRLALSAHQLSYRVRDRYCLPAWYLLDKFMRLECNCIVRNVTKMLRKLT